MRMLNRDEVVLAKQELADLVTGLWRIRRYLPDPTQGSATDAQTRSISITIQGMWSMLVQTGITAQDHTGVEYFPGMVIDVLAFQPDAQARKDMISETVRPTIYLREELLHRGEVIVTTPAVETQRHSDPDRGQEPAS